MDNKTNKHEFACNAGKITEYEVKEHIDTIMVGFRGFSKEVSIVKWNDKKPVFDIRAWRVSDRDGLQYPLRGITFSKEELIRNRAYDYANEKDDTQAVQSKALQLMSQMPKVMNSNHANRITKVLTDSINSGVIGSKAVLELLKYPAYADMVSAKIRERAFEGSKSSAEQAFDRLKESELKEAEQGLASVYMQGFHLRNVEKQVNAFKKPSAWNPDEQTA